MRGHLVQQKGMMQQGMKPRSAISTADAQLHRPTSRVTATAPVWPQYGQDTVGRCACASCGRCVWASCGRCSFREGLVFTLGF